VGQSANLVSAPIINLTSTSRKFEYWFRDTNTGHDLSLGGKPIDVKVNDTEFTCTTDPGIGIAEFTRDFPAVNNNLTTYIITATFVGDNPAYASATSTAPDGTNCAACTTTQYNGYEPSTNTIVLTVDPHSVLATTATKTPEEMQQDAQDSGWFDVYSEWSWWYPWYRLHVKIHVNPTIDIGFNPILPGGETHGWDGLERFAAVTEEALEDVGLDLAGMFAEYVVAKVTSIVDPIIGIVVEATKLGVGLVLLCAWWEDIVAVGAAALVSFLMGLVAINTDIAGSFLLAICKLIVGSAASALQWICDQMLQIVCTAMLISRWWIDAMEVTFDWILGGLALAHYCGVL
jgi:hypothetical protein